MRRRGYGHSRPWIIRSAPWSSGVSHGASTYGGHNSFTDDGPAKKKTDREYKRGRGGDTESVTQPVAPIGLARKRTACAGGLSGNYGSSQVTGSGTDTYVSAQTPDDTLSVYSGVTQPVERNKLGVCADMSDPCVRDVLEILMAELKQNVEVAHHLSHGQKHDLSGYGTTSHMSFGTSIGQLQERYTRLLDETFQNETSSQSSQLAVRGLFVAIVNELRKESKEDADTGSDYVHLMLAEQMGVFEWQTIHKVLMTAAKIAGTEKAASDRIATEFQDVLERMLK